MSKPIAMLNLPRRFHPQFLDRLGRIKEILGTKTASKALIHAATIGFDQIEREAAAKAASANPNVPAAPAGYPSES